MDSAHNLKQKIIVSKYYSSTVFSVSDQTDPALVLNNNRMPAANSSILI